MEAPLGVPLGPHSGSVPTRPDPFAAVLLGGYGGGWVPTAEALTMPFTEEVARAHGASIGAGVVALLPADRCPLREVAAVARYLEASGAGQCGPCIHGLAEMADQLALLADQPQRFRGIEHLRTVCDLAEGRGACAHPDGAARFVRSAPASSPITSSGTAGVRSAGTRHPSSPCRGPRPRRCPCWPAGPPSPGDRGDPGGRAGGHPGHAPGRARYQLVLDPIACDGPGCAPS